MARPHRRDIAGREVLPRADDEGGAYRANGIDRFRRADDLGIPRPHTLRCQGGEGGGTVTLPGLKIPPGAPALTPVPRAMKPEARIQLPRGFGAFHPMRNSSAVPSCSGTCARTSDLGYGLFPSDAFPKIFIFSALYSRAPPRSFCRTPRLCPPGKFLRLSAKAEDSRRCFRARREPYASRALR